MQLIIESRLTLRYHWPNGVVPYTIDAAFTSTERAAIASGIDHIHENSCVRSFKYPLQLWRFGNLTDLSSATEKPTIWTSSLVTVVVMPSSHTAPGVEGTRLGLSRAAVSPSRSRSTSCSTPLESSTSSAGWLHVSCYLELNILLHRPDRDDYVIVNWSNIRGGGASQYLRDAWADDSEASLPAKCSTTGADGEDMQSCYSGWRVGLF